MSVYDEIAKSCEENKKRIKDIQRRNERIEFMWEMYKIQKDLNIVNRNLDRPFIYGI